MSTQLAGLFCAAAMALPLTLPKTAPKGAVSGSDVAIQMKNVDFRIADDIVLEIRACAASSSPRGPASQSRLTTSVPST